MMMQLYVVIERLLNKVNLALDIGVMKTGILESCEQTNDLRWVFSY